jgi:hypothetical protein
MGRRRRGWAHLDDDGTFSVTNPYGGVRTTARALLVC